MTPDSRRVRLAVAVLSALVALLFSRPAESIAGPPGMWMSLLAGVVFGAWYGGLKPGLIGTTILASGAVFLYETGIGRPTALEAPLPGEQQSERAAALLFFLVSLAVCIAMQRLRMEGFRSAHAQARLREVLDSTLDAVVSVDVEFRCVYANGPAARLAKRTPTHMFGRSLRTLFPETPGVLIYRELARSLREGTPVQLEHRVEQTGRRYDIRGWPNAAGLTLFIRDVTGARDSELALHATTRQLRLEQARHLGILGELPTGIVIVTPAMIVEFANPAAKAMTGSDLRAGQLFPAPPAIVGAVAAGHRLSGVEAEFKKADGAAGYARIDCTPLVDPTGRHPSAVIICSEITPLRVAEKVAREAVANLQRVFDSSAIGIVLCRQDRVVDANPEFLRLTGHIATDFREGTLGWPDLTPVEFRDLDTKAMGQLMERGLAETYDKEILHATGRRLPVRISSLDFKSSGMFSWVAFVEDLTPVRALETRVQDGVRLEGLGRLAAGVVHDFNNLLTGVVGHVSEALDQLPNDHAVADSLRLAIRAGERATDLAGQLLSFSGRGRFAPGLIDVGRLIRESSQLMKAAIPRGVELRFALDPDLPFVEADSTQLQQLVMNLVINGAQAAGDKGGRVTVSTMPARVSGATDLTDGAYVSIRVEDTGDGMDAMTRERIFDPFFTTKVFGHGLGLAAAKDIVEAHGGAIRVTSVPGEGSSFEVLIPASESAPVAAAPGAVVLDAEDPFRDWDNHGATVLVVDGEEVVRSLAKAALERRGYTVVPVADSREAVEICRGVGHSISAVVLDANTAGGGTEDAVRSLRALSPTRPIIVTGSATDGERLGQLQEAGIFCFLHKPYTGDLLAAKVRAALDRDDD